MAPRLFACFKSRGTHTKAASLEAFERKDAAAAELSAEELLRSAAVVVELFSSQGCETSPQAEIMVSRLGRGDFALEMPVIVLAYHVDYWDYMGWKDPFGSSLWTVRQKAYIESLKMDTMYTPQLVIQGRVQCVGNDEKAMLAAIKNSPRIPPLAFEATFLKPRPEWVEVSLSGHLRTKMEGQANVMVALYENGLVTDCSRGENKGKVLSNDFVVRKLEKLCTVKDISGKKNLSGTVSFALWEGFKSSKCGIALFVQATSHQIFGSQRIVFPDDI